MLGTVILSNQLVAFAHFERSPPSLVITLMRLSSTVRTAIHKEYKQLLA